MTDWITGDSYDSECYPALDRPLPCEWCGQPRYEDARGGCAACGAPLASWGPSPVEQVFRFGNRIPISDEMIVDMGTGGYLNLPGDFVAELHNDNRTYAEELEELHNRWDDLSNAVGASFRPIVSGLAEMFHAH
jgi:hypothetical protein